MDIVISDTRIDQDLQGRYCLNALHRAAGGEERHSPNRWTRTEGYQSLVSELTPEMAFAPAESVRGGSAPGTYVCKELVYAYAMWVSPAFHLKVIRTFDSLSRVVDPRTQMMIEQLVRLDHLEQTQKSLEHKVNTTSARLDAIETATNYFTVIGYFRYFLKQGLNSHEAGEIGRRLSRVCRNRGIRIGEVPDPKFGKINTYPKDIIDEYVHETEPR